MDKKKLNLLRIVSVFCTIFIGVMTFAICKSIYDLEPELKHAKAVMILGALNAVPTMAAVIRVVLFANALKYSGTCEDIKNFFIFMKKVFYVQVVYTLVSVFTISAMENAGPPFYFFATVLITFASLTLALLFDTLYHLAGKAERGDFVKKR